MLAVGVFYCCIVSVLTITSEITKHPTSHSSLVGSKVTFSCRISNLPAHVDVVQWTRNGTVIVKDGGAGLSIFYLHKFLGVYVTSDSQPYFLIVGNKFLVTSLFSLFVKLFTNNFL